MSDSSKTSRLLSEREIFLSFCREESLPKAAKTLGVYPSTVSRAITALENFLNTKLVEKQEGRLVLTETGRRYSSILDENISFIHEFESKLIQQIMEVDIISPEWVQNHIIVPTLSKFTNYHNIMRTNLVISSSITRMRLGTPTIFVGSGRLDRRLNNMLLKNICEVPLGIYSFDKNAFSANTPLDVDDVKNLSLINVVDGDGKSVINFHENKNLHFPYAVMTVDALDKAFFLGLEHKCTFVSCYGLVQSALETGDCIEVPLKTPMDKLPLDLIFTDNNNKEFMSLARSIHEFGQNLLGVYL
ncbi:helix-turn-helix domain-containing protein [Acetobacter sp.]|uniref:helix-turn-helix domain-containing protein n=1 Tax=Acetobacter sp. TaxID=440 RepID=UPI0039ED0CC5